MNLQRLKFSSFFCPLTALWKNYFPYLYPIRTHVLLIVIYSIFLIIVFCIDIRWYLMILLEYLIYMLVIFMFPFEKRLFSPLYIFNRIVYSFLWICNFLIIFDINLLLGAWLLHFPSKYVDCCSILSFPLFSRAF
jgi:hypothetical protein